MTTPQRRNRNRGKAAERAIAKMLGGKRIGTMGEEDVMHPVLSIEVKSRQSFVGEGWLKQAEANAPGERIAAVVVHIKGQPFDKSMVLLRITEFMELAELDYREDG